MLIIVLENQDHKDAIANPYLGSLAAQGAHLTNFRGLFHPSYSNYLAMVTGKEVPTHFDEQVDLNDRTVGDLLIDKGLTWKNYAEGYPRELDQYPNRCFTGHSVGRYTRKHVPFASFLPVQTTVQCRNIVNADQFSDDLENNTLPHYAFYSPDLDHDGHDPKTDPKKGLMNASDWLRSFLERYLPRLAATLVVVTYDESATDTEGPENHIYAVLLGDMVRPGQYGEPYTHYNVLRTIEENFGLGSLADGDSCAKPIEGIWK